MFRAQGRFMSPEFSVATQWLARGQPSPLWSDRKGAMPSSGRRWIPHSTSPIRSPVRRLRLIAPRRLGMEPARIALVAALQEQLPRDESRSRHSGSVSAQLPCPARRGFSLRNRSERKAREFYCDPLLFGRRVHRAVKQSGRYGRRISLKSLLTPHQQEVFTAQRFPAFEDARAAYTIERGLYVHVDPMLQKALQVVRQVQRARLTFGGGSLATPKPI